MDPNQSQSGNPSGITDPDLNGSNPRSDVPPAGLSGLTPSDTSQPRNQSQGTIRVTTQSQTGARVWTRPGKNLPGDDSTTRTHSTRPISPTPLSQTREQVAEMASLMASLVDKTRTQEIAYRNIADRLERTERELAEHRASTQHNLEICQTHRSELRHREPMKPSEPRNFRARNQHDTQVRHPNIHLGRFRPQEG